MGLKGSVRSKGKDMRKGKKHCRGKGNGKDKRRESVGGRTGETVREEARVALGVLQGQGQEQR